VPGRLKLGNGAKLACGWGSHGGGL
jgi:hypothetical protein